MNDTVKEKSSTLGTSTALLRGVAGGDEEHEILEYFPPWKLQDFGLGRGINGTDPQPWVNKLTLQVRDIVREDLRAKSTSSEKPQKMFKSNLIGTNEGGVVHHFVQEVTNIKEQKAKLDTSITVPNSPVSVGIGAEMSRSLTTTQKAIGRRVINRTVSFTMEYNDAAEEQLARHIIECTGIRGKVVSGSFMETLEGLEKSVREEHFKRFVDRYRITHYVSSISLGASTFTVQSESEYNKLASVGGNIGVQQIAQAKVSTSYVDKIMKKSKNVQKVGKLRENGTVEKEAVVDVKMEPISSLFQSDEFRRCMQSVLTAFFREKDYGKEGPYLISCHDGTIFLKVVQDENDHAFVYATTKTEDASYFYIVLTDDGNNPYEFYIGWQKSEATNKPGTMRYLNAPLSISGYNNGPLTLESLGKKQNSIFSVNSRLMDSFCGLLLRLQGSNNVNPEIWFKGLESFLIRCSRRRFGVDGYFAVQRNAGPAREQYRTICKADASDSHNRHIHMTFQLHPKDKKTDNHDTTVTMKNDETQASSRTEIQGHELIQEIQHD